MSAPRLPSGSGSDVIFRAFLHAKKSAQKVFIKTSSYDDLMYFADNIGEISDKDIVSELVLELGRQRGRSNRQPEAENLCQNQGVSLVSTAHKLSKTQKLQSASKSAKKLKDPFYRCIIKYLALSGKYDHATGNLRDNLPAILRSCGEDGVSFREKIISECYLEGKEDKEELNKKLDRYLDSLRKRMSSSHRNYTCSDGTQKVIHTEGTTFQQMYSELWPDGSDPYGIFTTSIEYESENSTPKALHDTSKGMAEAERQKSHIELGTLVQLLAPNPNADSSSIYLVAEGFSECVGDGECSCHMTLPVKIKSIETDPFTSQNMVSIPMIVPERVSMDPLIPGNWTRWPIQLVQRKARNREEIREDMLLKIQKYEANHRRCLPSRTNEEWLEALQKYADAYTDSHESPTSQEIPRPSQGAADDDENRLAHWISRLVTQANGKRGVDDETRVSSYDLLATKIRDILKKSNVEWWISKRRPGRPPKKFDSAKSCLQHPKQPRAKKRKRPVDGPQQPSSSKSVTFSSRGRQRVSKVSSDYCYL